MRYLTILVLCIGSTVFAQDSTSSRLRPPNHEFYLGMKSAYRNSSSFSNGFHLGGRYSFNHNWMIQASTVISPIQSLDITRNNALKDTYGTKGYLLLPWYNHSTVATVIRVRSGVIRTRSFNGRTTLKYHQTGIKLGYQYLQQTLRSRFGGIDYYQTDTTASGEEIYVSGYKSHILTAGIQQITTYSSEKSTFRIISQMNVLYAAKRGFSTIIHRNDGSYSHYSAIENIHSPKWQWGAQASVTCERFGTGHWGFYCSAEIAWTPMPGYKAKSIYYVPRGGEGTFPGMVALQLGVVYRIKTVE